MDSNFVTATAAALGTVVGATASSITTWLTQRTQSIRARAAEARRGREELYGQFITEASRLTVEAMSHSLEQPEAMVKLYGILGRIRLVAADPVLAAGEACCHRILDLYFGPNMTVQQMRAAIDRDHLDPIREFSTVARAELREIAAAA